MLTPVQADHIATQMAGRTPEPYRVFSDGTAIWVYAMAFGNGRICVGHAADRYSFDAGYCYQGIERAFHFADAWDGQGEPDGWYKNLQTQRYRPNGDPALERGADGPGL